MSTVLTTISVFLTTLPFGAAGKQRIMISDPQADIAFNNECNVLTWRRFGQDTPVNLDTQLVLTYRSDQPLSEVHSSIVRALLDIDRQFDDEDLIEAVTALTAKITAAQALGDNWQYLHSSDYYDSLSGVQFDSIRVVVV